MALHFAGSRRIGQLRLQAAPSFPEARHYGAAATAESRMDAAHWQVVSSPRDAGSATCTTTASDGRTLSYLRVDAARCDHRERRVAKGTVAYRRALPAWHHEDRPLLMIRATTRQARRISAAPTYCKRRNLKSTSAALQFVDKADASPILRASPAAASFTMARRN